MAKFKVLTPDRSFEVEANFLLEAIEIANSENDSSEDLDLIAVFDVEMTDIIEAEILSY